MLGEGWYRGNFGEKTKRKPSGKQLSLLVQLQINYTDGTSQTVISDEN